MEQSCIAFVFYPFGWRVFKRTVEIPAFGIVMTAWQLGPFQFQVAVPILPPEDDADYTDEVTV